MPLFEELKRRKVFRVGAAYLVAAWLVVQVAELVAESFGAPPWFMQMLLVLVALGLPVALFLAWAFDLTPKGLVRDEDVTPDAAASSSRLLSGVTVVLLVLALGYFVWESRFSERKPDTAGELTAQTEAQPAEEAGMGDSIAVLPFENFSGNPEDEYFADGLTDTLLHKLAQIDQLKVIARNSTFQFKGQNRDVREIGEILDVAVVLEGSVQRAGDQVRIIAQLVRTSDGAHLWSQSFDDSMANIFTLQDQVATDITKQLRIDLTAEQRRRMLRDGTDNPEAYELLIRAQNMETDFDDMSDVDDQDWPRLVLIRQAIELDPDYVQAWAYMSSEYNSLGFATRNSQKFKYYVNQAEIAARKALELEPDLHYGHAAMGWVSHRKGERLQAEQYFRRALELEPGSLGAMNGLALQIIGTNPEEALQLLDRVLELNPTNALTHRVKHFALSRLVRYDEAIAELRMALEKDPDAGLMYNDLADLLTLRKGRPDEAAVVVSRLLRQQPHSYEGLAAMLENWCWAGGDKEAEAWAVLLLEQHPASDRSRIRNATRLVAAGQFEAALDILESFSVDDDDRGWIASLRATSCLSLGQLECAQQQVRVSADDLAERRAQGSQPWGFGINQLVHELIIAEVTQNTDRAAISLSEVVDLIERETYFETKYYLRAGIAARENQVEHAMAILEQSLTAADPGIFGQDVLGMRPDHSLLLEPLRGLPEFEDWLQRHRQQRSALLDRMRQLENQGEIYSAASLERLAQE
jgi:TolB-like protein/Tfp pilus assembly protein PilF